ncbi:MAG: hypothetical protein COB23_06820 [Methylophaga sp.]|nr:MAG: hypothetical protein COB23_06820 [Methylophaga sp.]
MITIILTLLGLFIGAAVAEEEGLVLGLFIGLAFGMISSMKGRISKLEQELEKVTGVASHSEISDAEIHSQQNPEGQPHADSTVFSSHLSDMAKTLIRPEVNDVFAHINKFDDKPKPAAVESDWAVFEQTEHEQTAADKGHDLADKVYSKIRDFFTTGNVVVKIGAIVLFFGVAFLLKYAAERSLFPIELRLAGVIAAGIGMLMVGWRLREQKLEYGLILQGVGIGLLYLTVFAASKFYQVLPANFTFVMMFLLVVLSGVLAVQQNAKSLALFGAVGGFLAPILMSTGGGSHISLFSYYTLLNVGILGIAWFKSWRVLNLVGFVFTFAISAAWGYQAYQAENFVSTESFLILFYAFYLMISILFSSRQAPKLKGYIDGTLVFGLPLIVFALQSRLVEQFEYGQAITAVVMAIIYLWLARQLWQADKNGMRLLAQSFLALAVTFASLAIPLYFDGRWTAAVWSLEGAALVWIGLRQSHLVPRVFGLLLSVGAGLIFIESTQDYLPNSIALLNSAFMGMVLVSLAAFLIAYLYQKNQQQTYQFEGQLNVIMVVWGLIWWFMAGVIEIERYVSNHYELPAMILFFALTTFVQATLSYQLSWSKISLSFILFTPMMVLLLLGDFAGYLFNNSAMGPFESLGYLAWPVALFTHFLVLRRKEQLWSETVLNIWHASGVVMIAFIMTWAVTDWLDGITNLASVWTMSAVGFVLVTLAESLMRRGEKIMWPVNQFKRAYYCWGLLPIMLFLIGWQVVAIHSAGLPSPLSYIPVINPLDIAQAIAFSVIVGWMWFINKSEETQIVVMPATVIYGVAGVMSFIWLNTVIARSVHFFADVSYSRYSLMHSTVYQSTTSIVWSLIAVILMSIGSKKSYRLLWFIGAGLLALVVAKLFLIDLADSGSISRIITFLVVGGLMLVIGYLSPLPPKPEQAQQLA